MGGSFLSLELGGSERTGQIKGRNGQPECDWAAGKCDSHLDEYWPCLFLVQGFQGVWHWRMGLGWHGRDATPGVLGCPSHVAHSRLCGPMVVERVAFGSGGCVGFVGDLFLRSA
jgi:hypothetical protein